MLPLASCIVADPPQYEAPKKTAPLLDLTRAQPLVTEVIVRDLNDNNDTNDEIDFSVPVRSEDVGEDVWFALHVDYTFVPLEDSFAVGTSNFVPASTFDDASRSLTINWSPRRVDDGCHALTLLVAHAGSWNFVQNRPDIIRAAGDSAMVTWWLNLNPPPDDPYTLQDCPNRSEVEQ